MSAIAETPTEPTILVLLGENDEVVGEVVLSDEEFNEIQVTIEDTGETLEGFVNRAIREGLDRDEKANSDTHKA